MWNGNNYGGYSPNTQSPYLNPYNQPYNGYSGTPNNYIAPNNFAPQNANYAPQNQPQPNMPMNTNKIYVTGIEGARAMQFPPNSDYILLDNDKPLLYRKTVDATGKMEIKTFDISEHTEQASPVVPQIDISQFVSIDDFKAVQNEVIQLRKTIDRLTTEKAEKPIAPYNKPKKEVTNNG